MNTEATLERFREYLLGPARFITLMACFELGIVDALRDGKGMTADQLGDTVGAAPDAVEQLLLLMVKEEFLAYDESSATYSLDGLGTISEIDLRRVLTLMNMIKITMLRQGFYLTESVRAGVPVGLEKTHGFVGNLYEAVAEHQDLRDSWATAMDTYSEHIDPWFFDNIDIPLGAKVLDLAGNTGLGAMLTHKFKSSHELHVTTFDLPEKEAECLRNFKDHGMEDRCSFIGGNVFESVPDGFDVVLVKHFMDMWDKHEVHDILRGVNRALSVGGQVNILVPVYPEDIKETCSVDFFPAFFLGSSMGKGGPQKLSTYRSWLEECGFKVTKAMAQDTTEMPPDSWSAQGILCATKVA